MLGASGVLPQAESDTIVAALRQVESEMQSNTFQFVPSDEDIHTAIERRVTEIAGATGAKLHTGRSRNDQSVTALRLFAKRELTATAHRVLGLIDVLDRRAEDAAGTYLPGYTHLQRAQPVLLSHHLRAHAWALTRDVDRMLDALVRTDVSPLGAGALAGTSLPTDAHDTQKRLGFADIFANSLDAVSDRDFVAEGLFVLTLIPITYQVDEVCVPGGGAGRWSRQNTGCVLARFTAAQPPLACITMKKASYGAFSFTFGHGLQNN
jgi:argininosuccinate lyase